MLELKKAFLPVLLAGVWVNACEFIRNELLFKHYWVDHFAGMGLVFPSQPVNSAAWVVWGFSMAAFVWALSRRFCLRDTFLLSWFAGFLMMWMVAWNLSVLPVALLWIGVPFSMAELLGASFIVRKF